MPVNRPTTAYSLVANSLRQRILSGQFKPAEQVPTERELCESFQASRITIRRALQILEDEMLVQRRQGSGTYVNSTPSRKIPLLNTDASGSMALHAPELKRKLDRWKWQPASVEVAAALRIMTGDPVLFARRLDMLRGRPVAFDDVHLAQAAADRLQASDLEELHFLKHWEEVQRLRLTHLSQAIEAIAAPAGVAHLLRLRKGAPALKETDVVFDAADRPVGLFVSYYRPDRFRLTSTVRLELGRFEGEMQ